MRRRRAGAIGRTVSKIGRRRVRRQGAAKTRGSRQPNKLLGSATTTSAADKPAADESAPAASDRFSANQRRPVPLSPAPQHARGWRRALRRRRRAAAPRPGGRVQSSRGFSGSPSARHTPHDPGHVLQGSTLQRIQSSVFHQQHHIER